MLLKALDMVQRAYKNFRQNSDLTHPDTRLAARARRRLEIKLNPGLINSKKKFWHGLMENMYKRKWRGPIIDGGEQTKGNKIRIMHWNLLADKLAYPDFKKGGFGCPFELLDWDGKRKDKVIAEIIHYQPDVLVLVELDHYEDIRMVLQEDFGYQSIWKKKNKNFYTDGTGIFWKKDRFDSGKIWKKPLAKKLGSIEEADQVFVAVELRPSDSSEEFTPFVVGGCHLKSTKAAKGEKKRLDQSKQIMEILDKEFRGLPVILGSDMNAEATAQKYDPLAYPYMVKNGLSSAYATVLGEEPKYTSWKFRLDEYNDMFSDDKVTEWKYTIDFIFHTDDLKTLAVLDVPGEEEIDKAYNEPRKDTEESLEYAKRRMLLPNELCPSDHLSILAEILLPKRMVGEDEKQN
jgi:mRNA deadenylase 3'-5' endonuclease subunit Ccr4